MNYEVTLTKADGYVFNYGFADVAAMRDFMALTTVVMGPRETLTWRVL